MNKIIYVKSIGGLLLFLVQYASLVILLVSGPIIPEMWYTWLPYIPGWVIGIWAVLSMGQANLNMAPDILPTSRLVTSGPYKLIRHPMYAALLLVFIPLVITKPSLLRVLILIVLIVNLMFKLFYEERRLREHFSHYPEYSANTWRLIPYVF